MFVVIEGLDGCGKTSVTEGLQQIFPNFHYTREPGGTPFAESVREVMLGFAERPAMSDLLAMYSARMSHCAYLKEVLKEKHVLTQRFYQCSIAYQGSATGNDAIPADVLRKVHNLCKPWLLEPDLVVFLDVPPEVSRQRMSGRKKDYFESKGPDFFASVRRSYLEQCGPAWLVVDATRPLSQVIDTVARRIGQCM